METDGAPRILFCFRDGTAAGGRSGRSDKNKLASVIASLYALIAQVPQTRKPSLRLFQFSGELAVKLARLQHSPSAMVKLSAHGGPSNCSGTAPRRLVCNRPTDTLHALVLQWPARAFHSGSVAGDSRGVHRAAAVLYRLVVDRSADRHAGHGPGGGFPVRCSAGSARPPQRVLSAAGVPGVGLQRGQIPAA